MDGEICTKCHRTIPSASQLVVMNGKILCSRCALDFGHVEVQKQYIPPPASNMPTNDPWAARKRRPRRTYKPGQFGRLVKRLAAVALIGVAIWYFSPQLKPLIHRFLPSPQTAKRSLSLPRTLSSAAISAKPAMINANGWQVSIFRYGWVNVPHTSLETTRGLVVEVKLVAPSNVHLGQSPQWNLKYPDARIWPPARHQAASEWMPASAVSLARPAGALSGHFLMEVIHFMFHGVHRCNWVTIRITNPVLPATKWMQFKLSRPPAISASQLLMGK